LYMIVEWVIKSSKSSRGMILKKFISTIKSYSIMKGPNKSMSIIF